MTLLRRPSPVPSAQRAYALPLVILLALVGTLAVTVILNRFAVAHGTVHRQVETYTGHHFSMGIKEVTSRWISTVRGDLTEGLDEDGLAFRLELPHNLTVEVYMEDGQGAALTDSISVDGRQREIVADMKAYLDSLPPETLPRNVTRPAGPASISIMAAPRAVLEALAFATVEPRSVQGLVDALVDAQDGDEDPGAALSTAMAAMGLTDDERDEIESMITTKPVLYRVVAQTVDGRERIIARSGGLMMVDERNSISTISQTGAFLTWEELPVQPQ